MNQPNLDVPHHTGNARALSDDFSAFSPFADFRKELLDREGTGFERTPSCDQTCRVEGGVRDNIKYNEITS